MILFLNPKRFGCPGRLPTAGRHLVVVSFLLGQVLLAGPLLAQAAPRERISIDDNWRFTKGDPASNPVSLLYDVRQQQAVKRLAEAEADGNASPGTLTNSNNSTNLPAIVIKPGFFQRVMSSSRTPQNDLSGPRATPAGMPLMCRPLSMTMSGSR